MSKFNSEKLRDQTTDQLLKEADVGRLATCNGTEPYIVPLSFVYENNRIIFHGSREGKKMENIVSNPNVCFEVDECEFVSDDDPCRLHWKFRSVIARGIARILEDREEIEEALRLLVDKYAPGKGNLLTRQRIESYEKLAVVEITVQEVTEKKEID